MAPAASTAPASRFARFRIIFHLLLIKYSEPSIPSAEGLTAAQIGTMVKQMLDGEEVTTLKVDGQEISVKAEYPEDQYKTVPQLDRCSHYWSERSSHHPWQSAH